ncbi:MAG: putative membrane protein YczE [Acidimicrobiales bacterium]|jgi:uncharacterized membrane protein YczE
MHPFAVIPPQIRATLGRIDLDLASSLIGSGRHTAVPALRRVTVAVPTTIVRQTLSLATGSLLIGIAVALMVQAQLGLSPYDVLSLGLGDRFGLTLGQSGLLLAAILFGVAALLGRRPSLWGLVYIFANGLSIDAASHLLSQPTTMPVRLSFVAAAIFTMAAGIGLVVHSGTTGGPFELLMLAGEDRQISRRATRSMLDCGVLFLGVLMGGEFGPATLVYAACMGLVLQTTYQALTDHRVGRQFRKMDIDPRTAVAVGT